MNSLVRTINMFHRSLSSVCITVICLKNCGLKNAPEIFLVLLFLLIISKIITEYTAIWEVGDGVQEKIPYVRFMRPIYFNIIQNNISSLWHSKKISSA